MEWNYIKDVGLPKEYGNYFFTDDLNYYTVEKLHSDEAFNNLSTSYIAWIKLPILNI